MAKKKVSAKKKASAKSSSSRTGGVKVGASVKDFSLPSTSGEDFKLSEREGKITVLYFYPKDSTPGCTVEGQDFTQLHKRFRSLDAEVYGISKDSLKSHHNFKTKQNYSVDLLSDEEGKACRLFDVIKEKNMYGKKFLGIERSTFVIDREGRLVKEWRGVKVPGHAEEVLEFVKTL